MTNSTEKKRKFAGARDMSNNKNNKDSRRDNDRTWCEKNIVHAPKTYERDNPKTRATQGLQNENFDKKVKFLVFYERIVACVMKE